MNWFAHIISYQNNFVGNKSVCFLTTHLITKQKAGKLQKLFSKSAWLKTRKISQKIKKNV